MTAYKERILREIKNENPWYTGSQFAWAERECIRRIYIKRQLFFYSIINREISKKGHITILDYGCGDGYWSFIFSQNPACEVTGTDYNSLRLQRAGSLVKNARFIEKDLTDVNTEPEKFDIVFCSQVIEHVEDDISFLKGIKSYLKEDGVLIIGTTNEGCLTQRLRRYITKEKTDHVHFYTEREIQSKIEKAGFIITDLYREVFYPGFDNTYYKLTSTDLGFKILERLTVIFPSQCSDYYFQCKIKGRL